MMRGLLLGSCLVGLLVGAGAAEAVLIDRGASTYDSRTGLEWLDLPLTQGQSYDAVVAGFGGYVGQGYVHATAGQVCGLWGALGDHMTSCGTPGSAIKSGPLAAGNAIALIDLLGETYAGSAYGIYDSGQVGSGWIGLGCINDPTSRTCYSNHSPPNWLMNGSWGTTAGAHPWVGHWLVRSGGARVASFSASVPEPASMLLLALGFVGFGLVRSRRD